MGSKETEMSDRYTCEDVFRRLDDYLDRELSADEIRLVEEHLKVCAMCAREHAFEEGVIRHVRAKLQRLAVPPDLLQRISTSLVGARGE
jgi:anti-sigma factor (TIGR02949 family)